MYCVSINKTNYAIRLMMIHPLFRFVQLLNKPGQKSSTGYVFLSKTVLHNESNKRNLGLSCTSSNFLSCGLQSSACNIIWG